MVEPDIDPDRFATHRFGGRGLQQAYVHEGVGGVPLLLVHGWPETKRIFWRVIEPLADAGFEVIVPDLRGFGDSEVGPDGFHDVAAHSRDLHALVTEGLGHDRVVLCGGDLGGPVVQDLALRFPDLTDRLVPVQLAAALRQGGDGRDGHPPAGRGERLLHPPGHRPRRAGRRADHARAAPALHRHLLHVPVLVPPRRVHGRARRWALGAARSTSTPSRSPTPARCGRRSAATRACSPRPPGASRP